MHENTQAADFASVYNAIAGKRPYLWQQRIGREIGGGDIPSSVVVPTGGGKTGIIASWMTSWIVALMDPDVSPFRIRIPRRIVWVVNRRTVVDDIGTEAATIARRIIHGAGIAGLRWGRVQDDLKGSQHEEILKHVAEALDPLAGLGNSPIAVSSLRGELVDEGAWRVDPARLGIIIGTPMFVGSKLLFRGVDDGRSRRAQSASLIGSDSLIVHDESHLEPAFDNMLDDIRQYARLSADGLPRTFLSCRLSATPAAGGASDAFTLNEYERAEDRIRAVLETKKRMKIVVMNDKGSKDERDAVVRHALDLGGNHQGSLRRRIIVFVRSPEEARKVADQLADKVGRENVGLLTGTMRGRERDRLTASALFSGFRTNLHRDPPERSVYLVATSAGEVGVDIDGDAAVIDGCTLDSLAQRLGRVGRAGNRPGHEDEPVEVVSVWRITNEKSDLSSCIETTLEIISERQDGGFVSVGPAEMTDLVVNDARAGEASMPKPMYRRIGANNWDGWRNTSNRPLEGKITLEQHIIGASTWDPPTTEVAWRAEIDLLCAADEDQLVQMMERFPTRAAERLSTGSRDVCAWLEARWANGARGCFISTREGRPRVVDLGEMINGGKINRQMAGNYISNCDIIVPTSWGGLSVGGMLDGEADDPADHKTLDVAEIGDQMSRQRVAFIHDEDEHEVSQPLLEGKVDPRLRTACVVHTPNGRIEYRVQPSVQAASVRVGLQEHLEAVASACGDISRRLGLDESYIKVMEIAGMTHDIGKEDPRWQLYANNAFASDPVAKSESYTSPRVLCGFRHEAASVGNERFLKVADGISDNDMRQLLHHVVAAHHGWGRPGFPAEAGHPDVPEQMNRFKAVECSFGIYQTPLLETIVKCADAIVSMEESR